jgi:hypothetical protein
MARTPTAARFHLELDGIPCGFLRSVEGGSVSAEVVREKGSEHFVEKRLGSAAPEPIVLTFGLGLEPTVYKWIAEFCSGSLSRRAGSVVFADSTLTSRKALAFEEAHISALGIPAQDGASKDPCFIKLTIQPGRTTSAKASGKVRGTPAARGKQWVASNFLLDIPDLDCKRVARVDGFTVELATADPVGEERIPVKDSTIDFPDLRITLLESGAATWAAWHEDFVVLGNSDDGHEKSGSLMALDPTLATKLLRVDFEGLGIYRLAPEKVDAAAEAPARVRAELYCERMAFSV